ncbi:MAG: hypothetical protein ACI4B9_05710 [Eggerthellaceae bacterium]
MEHGSGIYDFARKSVISRFSQHIHGAESGLIAALFATAPSPQAQNALEKSALAIGWGSEAVCFVETDMLEPSDLLQIVEGMDPVAVVLASASSAQAFFAAYHLQPVEEERLSVLCREVRIIPRFEELMETPDGKQRIWAALKTLPRP